MAFEAVVAGVKPSSFVLDALDLLSRVLSQWSGKISRAFLVTVLDHDLLIGGFFPVVADQPIIASLGDLEVAVEVA